jgi:ubiquinone/menaquinone biosynthesis C-methylase UbiE
VRQLREEEHEKYKAAYQGSYGMGKARKMAAFDAIASVEVRGSLLDVGCGRGEILDYAETEGFTRIRGVDVVPELFSERVSHGEAHSLPFVDDEFDVVTCFDVLEHLLPDDTDRALSELDRVSYQAVILSAANYPSRNNGDNLHINIRAYKQWDKLIRKNIHGDVSWVPRVGSTHSETWIILK